MTQHHHKSKKALTSVLLAAVVFAGIYYFYDQGFIPGIGSGEKNAEILEAKIKELEGKNIETAVYNLVSGSSLISHIPSADKQSYRKSLKDRLDKDVDIIFSYSDLERDSDGANGVVKIINPRLTVVSVNNGAKDYDVTLPALYVTLDSSDYHHYQFKAEGDVEFLSDVNKTGEKSKTFALKYEDLAAETKFAEGYVALQKIFAKDLKLVEGRSGTMLISAAEIVTETKQTQEENKRRIESKARYSRITPGDMIKLFIGNIQPVDIKVNYVSEEPLEPSNDKKTLDGSLKLENFSVKMHDAGLESNADIKYSTASENSSQGKAYIKFTQYHKILGLLRKYYPIKPEDMRSVSKFLMEVGADEGEDASFDIEFDAKQQMLINGKPETEFNRIFDKHFPPLLDGEVPAKDSEATPIEPTPTIEKKKL